MQETPYALLLLGSGGILSLTLRYLLAAGGWVQGDKARLWQEVGALRGEIKALRAQLDQADSRERDQAVKLALAEERETNLRAGYERLKSQCAELEETLRVLRRQLQKYEKKGNDNEQNR